MDCTASTSVVNTGTVADLHIDHTTGDNMAKTTVVESHNSELDKTLSQNLKILGLQLVLELALFFDTAFRVAFDDTGNFAMSPVDRCLMIHLLV